MIFLKEFLEKVNFEKKNQQTTKKHEIWPSGQRVDKLNPSIDKLELFMMFENNKGIDQSAC